MLIKNTDSRDSLQAQRIITQEVVPRNLRLTDISYIHTKVWEELREMINLLIKTEHCQKKKHVTFGIWPTVDYSLISTDFYGYCQSLNPIIQLPNSKLNPIIKFKEADTDFAF